MLRSVSYTTLSFVIVWLLGGSALASPQTKATALVKKNYDAIKRMVASAKDRDELAEQITQSLDSLIDWPSFSTKTMSKKTWDELGQAQKDTFIGAYRKLIVRRYAKRFKPGSDFRVEIRPTDESDETETWVKTTVHSLEERKNWVWMSTMNSGRALRAIALLTS